MFDIYFISYDTAHNCTFDYKTTGREELRKNNPQVLIVIVKFMLTLNCLGDIWENPAHLMKEDKLTRRIKVLWMVGLRHGSNIHRSINTKIHDIHILLYFSHSSWCSILSIHSHTQHKSKLFFLFFHSHVLTRSCLAFDTYIIHIHIFKPYDKHLYNNYLSFYYSITLSLSLICLMAPLK